MAKKLSYIWDYYKPHIFITLVVIYFVCFFLHRAFFTKPVDLYISFVNVTTGKAVHEELIENYDASNIYTYEDLLITENVTNETYSYVEASEIKILGAIDTQKLDIVIMDKEALNAFSSNGYLMNLDKIIDDQNIWSSIQSNVIDNIAIDISDCPAIKDAGFPSNIYLGVIANTTHEAEAVNYISYIVMPRQ